MKRLCVAVMLVTCAVLFLSGCSDKSTNGNGTPAPLMPLAVGNSWTFMEYDIDFETRDTTEVGQDVMTISGSWMRGDDELFRLAGLGDVDSALVQVADDGLVIELYYSDGGSFQQDLFFKYPATDGGTYTFDMMGFVSATVIVTVEDVETPAGTFESYCYTISVYDDTIEFCFAPGVGPVRQADITNDEFSLLLSYEIAE